MVAACKQNRKPNKSLGDTEEHFFFFNSSFNIIALLYIPSITFLLDRPSETFWL